MRRSALLFTAVATPFEVAVLDPPPTWEAAATDALFVLNRMIDLTFCADLLVHFVLGHMSQATVSIGELKRHVGVLQEALRVEESKEALRVEENNYLGGELRKQVRSNA